MEKECTICGKSSSMGGSWYKLISRYNPSIKRRIHPNLQWVTVPTDTTNKNFKGFNGKRILACTKCIKSLGKK